MHFKRQLSIDAYRAILLLPALSALIGPVAFWPAGIAAMGLITFLLITLGAVLLSTFLLGYEMHQHPLSQPLPSAGKNSGGGLIGLSSFTGNLIALLLTGFTDPKNLLILSWLNVLVVPYMLFAVWYQRRPVRQWSIACLGLPVVLAGMPLTSPDAPVVLKIMMLLILPLLAARLQIRTWRKNEENMQRPFFLDV
jgi:hypothetical protein